MTRHTARVLLAEHCKLDCILVILYSVLLCYSLSLLYFVSLSVCHCDYWKSPLIKADGYGVFDSVLIVCFDTLVCAVFWERDIASTYCYRLFCVFAVYCWDALRPVQTACGTVQFHVVLCRTMRYHVYPEYLNTCKVLPCSCYMQFRKLQSAETEHVLNSADGCVLFAASP